MSKPAQHTPWRVTKHNEIIDANNDLVLASDFASNETLRNIIKAVNCHAELVAVLEIAADIFFYHETIEEIHGMTSSHRERADRVRAVLAKAKEISL